MNNYNLLLKCLNGKGLANRRLKRKKEPIEILELRYKQPKKKRKRKPHWIVSAEWKEQKKRINELEYRMIRN